MSKLPKAPLLEIILELRWKIINKQDLSRIQYLYGDLYAEMKDRYPFRESIVPPEIPIEILTNQPVHRYRTGPNDYPLIQVGPGIISLNTTDTKYFWEEFSKWSDDLLSTFLKVYPIDTNNQKLIPSLSFVDFFPFNFSADDVYDYINKNFNVSFGQSFFKNEGNPTNINIGFYYKVNLGDLSIVFQQGKNSRQEEGIVLQSRINGIPLPANQDEISNWINESHEICSELFKKLTEGKLYESFKK